MKYLTRLVSMVVVIIIGEQNHSNGMAVPKSRRSKSKGKVRLANWKRKANDVAKKAFSEAKKVFSKEQKEKISVSDENQISEVSKDIGIAED